MRRNILGACKFGNGSSPVVANDPHLGDSVWQRSDEGWDKKFSVVYAKVSTRKHKKWEADGFLIFRERTALLRNEDGADVARSSSFTKKEIGELCGGCRLVVGGYEVEIQEETTDFSTSENVISENTCYHEVAPPKKKFQPVTRQFTQPLLKNDDQRKAVKFIVNQDDFEKGMPEIVLDYRIASHLRQHQKDGIRFLYQKLKTISLIIALMKTTDSKSSTFPRRYLLIVPSTLLGNWHCEFSKWIPLSRSLVFQVKKTSEFNSYLRSARCSPIAVMSYEMAACIGEPLLQVPFALVVCDEAHRLKNLNGRMHHLVSLLNTERRLLLTGTPLQNEPDELFSLLNLARPDAFGTVGEFRKLLDGTTDDSNLRELMSDTLLRRTAEVNNQYLPQKCEYLIFCRLSELQREIYERIRGFITDDHLLLIDMLKKLCNHPSLLYQSAKMKLESSPANRSFYGKVLDTFPSSFASAPLLVSDSGKLSVFMEMMSSFRELNEKVVIVSNFTKTLDMLGTLCSCLYFQIYRLDGSVQQQKRIRIVNDFNSSLEPHSVFLLSTKAGGVGLNLIGASRLILYDSEWNPAVDVQAMARIWRDGQTRPCHIYRLVTTGTIDEKILQRQIMKTGLSTVIEVEEVAAMAKVEFSTEDLYDIFKCDSKTLCNTHDLMECDCKGCGMLIAERESVDQEEQEENGEVDSTARKDFDGRMDTENDIAVAEVEGEKKTSLRDIPLNISLAALLQWRHYAHEYVEQFELFKTHAGLASSTLDDVTFAMKIVRNY